MKKEIFDMEIPEWAMGYLVNGDTDNLTSEDIELIQDFQKANRVLAVSIKEDSEPYFSGINDVGGLAGNVYDCDVLCEVE